MTSGAQTREGRFVVVGWSFHGILIDSRVFLPSRSPSKTSIHCPGLTICLINSVVHVYSLRLTFGLVTINRIFERVTYPRRRSSLGLGYTSTHGHVLWIN
jgi:hypothetical protein